MHAQLASIVADFEFALTRLRGLVTSCDEDAWSRRSAPESWSAAECVAHLNITSAAYLRILPAAVAEARARSGGAPARYRLDLPGWLVKQVSGRKRLFPTKTPAAFVPASGTTRDVVATEFERLQAEQIAIVASVDGLPIHKVRIASPFAANLRYSLYSALSLLPGHQHRHLDQAERALAAVMSGA